VGKADRFLELHGHGFVAFVESFFVFGQNWGLNSGPTPLATSALFFVKGFFLR
jgi:hypothetical protein